MPLAAEAHNSMLDSFAGRANQVTLLNTISLSAAASAGATTVTLSDAVALGDYISLNDGGNRETFEVTGGGGTTSPTLDHALVNAYSVNSSVGWAPKGDATLPEVPAITRQTISWSAATGEALSKDATAVKFTVDGGNEIGSFAVFESATATTYLGSFLTNALEGFGSQGTYTLTDADVTLSS